MNLDKNTYILTDKGRYANVSLGIGVAGLLLSLVGYFINSEQFYFSWLTAFCFWVTIGAGGLFMVMLHYLVGARWSVVLRKFAESAAWTLPFMIVFGIPIIFGRHDLFHWTHEEAVAHDHLLQGKEPFLNTPFFIIRMIIYFGVWFYLAWRLNQYSDMQDEAHTGGLLKKMRRISAPGMILFALTITFAGFDWMMSLDPHWYSTIFGVYIFSGGVVGFLAFLTMIALYFHKKNVLTDEITVEHYNDLGRLTFAFVIFWAYMAFSQYFLIWYANIPEETIWFLNRWKGSWSFVTLLIVFGNFVIPFFILITRAAKRNYLFLKIMMGWLFFMHLVDIYWIVMPTLHTEGADPSWIDITTVIGIGGIFCRIFFGKLTSRPMLPVKDPKLQASIEQVT